MRLSTQGFLYLHIITAKVSHMLPLQSLSISAFDLSPSMDSSCLTRPVNLAPSISKLLPES